MGRPLAYVKIADLFDSRFKVADDSFEENQLSSIFLKSEISNLAQKPGFCAALWFLKTIVDRSPVSQILNLQSKI